MVEDAEAIRTAVLTGLADAGFGTAGRVDGRALEQDLESFRPDLVVLDVMLPGRDGFALLDVVRRHSDAGVIMLTARDGVDDRLRGLHGGADDYVVKPFALAEVVARVTAVLRRMGRTPSTDRGRRPARGRGRRFRPPRGRPDRADGHRAPAARLPRRSARPRRQQGPDPHARLGLHRLRPQPRRGAHLGAAPQARRAAARAHGAGAGICAACRAGACGASRRSRAARARRDATRARTPAHRLAAQAGHGAEHARPRGGAARRRSARRRRLRRAEPVRPAQRARRPGRRSPVSS